MGNSHKVVEYELIGIEWELQYDLSDATPIRMVKDESDQKDSPQPAIEYDENGIPMGQSIEEIRIRHELIKTYYNEWLNNNPEASVLNEALDDRIYVLPVSVGEAMEHSAKYYRSTISIKHLSEILQKARPVGRVPVKVGNNRQSKFEYMLIMTYEIAQIGKIKLTIGVKKKTAQRVEYGLTVLREGESLINRYKKEKAPHKK